MKNINASALVSMMSNVKGATICTVDSLTVPKMNKRGNDLYGRVMKYTRLQLQFGYNYEKAVNNRLEAMGLEPNFEVAKRQWGEWVIPNKVSTHKGNLYLRFYQMANTDPESYFLVDGRLATREEVEVIKSFMPKPSASARQSEVGLNDRQVTPREYMVSSIKRIAVNGEKYTIEEEIEVNA